MSYQENAFECVDHNNWKILKEIGIPVHLTCLLRKLVCRLRSNSQTRTGNKELSKLRKEFIKAVYHHPVYLTSMQSTSCDMPGWMKHKLESRLLGEISITSDMKMISL